MCQIQRWDRTAIIAAGLLSAMLVSAQTPALLVYTRNGPTLNGGKGFVHDNVATNVAALRELCQARGITMHVSDDPAIFTAEKLKPFKAIVFANTNNQAFDTPAQSQAFEKYIRDGGGFVGIHSASGSERKNDVYKQLLGGRFIWHTPNQPFTIVVTDRDHAATRHLATTWAWADEGYICDLAPGVRVLLEMDISSVKKPERGQWKVKVEGDRFPLAWCQRVGAGRTFYTALGHNREHYGDPAFRQHLLGAILWAMDIQEAP